MRRRRRQRAGRLDVPASASRSLAGVWRPDPDAFGRFSERVARFFGTARFLVLQTVLVIGWMTVNVLPALHVVRWDPYPFILLNLAFSTQAAYAAPLILLAQTRQAERDRVAAEADRAHAERMLADLDYLTREVVALRQAQQHAVTRRYLRESLASHTAGSSRSSGELTDAHH